MEMFSKSFRGFASLLRLMMVMTMMMMMRRRMMITITKFKQQIKLYLL